MSDTKIIQCLVQTCGKSFVSSGANNACCEHHVSILNSLLGVLTNHIERGETEIKVIKNFDSDACSLLFYGGVVDIQIRESDNENGKYTNIIFNDGVAKCETKINGFEYFEKAFGSEVIHENDAVDPYDLLILENGITGVLVPQIDYNDDTQKYFIVDAKYVGSVA